MHSFMTNYGDEHIAELIPRAIPKISRPPKHISQFRPSIKNQAKIDKCLAKTMGMIATTPPSAQHYLKKNQGNLRLKLVSDGNRKRCWSAGANFSSSGASGIPKDKENQIPGPSQPHFSRNVKFTAQRKFAKKPFSDKIHENAIRNITSIPKMPKKIYVDSNNGNKNDLLTSGLVPRYSIQNNFGKVPKYIETRKKLVEKTQQEFDKFIYSQCKNEALSTVDADEKSYILNCLKDKWSKLHHEYQGLSVVTDTAPKKNRKEKLENAMSQIEKDIEFFERHDSILVEHN